MSWTYRCQGKRKKYPHAFRLERLTLLPLGWFEDEAWREVREWCAANLSRGWRNASRTNTQTLEIHIRHEDDAFAFRMRWC